MSTLPAISLHQPWATLCATRATWPDDLLFGVVPQSGVPRCPMVKRFETRSRPCPPKYVGQRIAIHAAKTPWPGGGIQRIGDYTFYVGRDGAWMAPTAELFRSDRRSSVRLPLGAVVATAVVTASLPIFDVRGLLRADAHVAVTLGAKRLYLNTPDTMGVLSIADQMPYGDWTPGRWAWALADVEPVAPPVPAKGRQGWFTVELP